LVRRSETCSTGAEPNDSAERERHEPKKQHKQIYVGLTPELTRRRPELIVDTKPNPGGRVE